MTYGLRFLPEVENDALAGYAWYEDKSPGLGDEFLRSFYACANEILRNPLISPKAHQEIRLLALAAMMTFLNMATI
ncbi:MAG: hypothetical protein ABSF90_28870 [Syntrophobacteraceae bacterium]|jgi:hypothetical protein